jgi:hypothetical protein
MLTQKGQASVLAPLNNLKYVELTMFSWPAKKADDDFFETCKKLSVTREDILSCWANEIPSLQYIELEIDYLGWKRGWWRVEAGEQNRNRVRQVSEEEGESAKHWFDVGEWQ